jgi:hypothetical protein
VETLRGMVGTVVVAGAGVSEEAGTGADDSPAATASVAADAGPSTAASGGVNTMEDVEGTPATSQPQR